MYFMSRTCMRIKLKYISTAGSIITWMDGKDINALVMIFPLNFIAKQNHAKFGIGVWRHYWKLILIGQGCDVGANQLRRSAYYVRGQVYNEQAIMMKIVVSIYTTSEEEQRKQEVGQIVHLETVVVAIETHFLGSHVSWIVCNAFWQLYELKNVINILIGFNLHC